MAMRNVTALNTGHSLIVTEEIGMDSELPGYDSVLNGI